MAKKPGNNAEAMLVGYLQRIESLKGEQKVLSGDIKDIFAEAKSAGFSPKIMRNVLRIRSFDPKTFEEEMEQTNAYLRATGMPEVDLSAAHDL